jgi:hypothetical protein
MYVSSFYSYFRYCSKNTKYSIEIAKPTPNRTVTVRRPVRAARLRKTPVGLAPFVVFYSATIWAGVVATQRPITCPNRQLQPERYVPLGSSIF